MARSPPPRSVVATREPCWRRVPIWGFVFTVAIGTRLAYLLTARGPAFDAPLIDADYYDYLGARLARGEGFDPGPFWQPPLYPLALGGLYALGGHSPWWPRLLQALLGALTAVLSSGVARRLTGRSEVALGAGLLVALHGPLVFYDGELLATSLGTFLATAALWLAVRETPRLGTALGCGVFLGLGALAVAPLLLLLKRCCAGIRTRCCCASGSPRSRKRRHATCPERTSGRLPSPAALQVSGEDSQRGSTTRWRHARASPTAR
jgi:hypothetical protein